LVYPFCTANLRENEYLMGILKEGIPSDPILEMGDLGIPVGHFSEGYVLSMF
jgi:hypothetical protein